MLTGAINTPPSLSNLAFQWHVHHLDKDLSLVEKYPQIKESDLIKGNCDLLRMEGFFH